MHESKKAGGRILHLYTGKVRESRIQGDVEPTAYIRSSCSRPLWLAPTGLSGNDLGTPRKIGAQNHAVYLFPQAHYAYFSDLLGRPISPGRFAENVSYDGPDENALRIGDQIRIGDALIELTLPRVPCYKMAHFVGTDPGFPSRFSGTGRTGVYARVLTPGRVAPADDLTVIRSDSRNATISELNTVLTAGKPRADIISRVIESPSLLPEVRKLIEDRLAALCLEKSHDPQRVRILTRSQETPNVVSLTFELPLMPTQIPRPGQFVTFGVEDGQGNRHFRCYSLSQGPFAGTDDKICRIAVKREKPDRGGFSVSNWLHDHITVGAVCTVYPPTGDFCLPQQPTGPLAFVAGGIGITPILPQLQALAATGYAAPVAMIYVARSRRELAFLDEVAEAAAGLEHFDLQVFVTRDDGTAEVSPLVQSGRPDLASWISDLDDAAQLFVCGPGELIDDVCNVHASLGRSNACLFYERFTDQTDGGFDTEPAPRAQITIGQGGMSGVWTPDDGSLLDWIETNTDLRPPAACRSGICRTCKAILTRGSVVYPSSVSAPSQTEVLLCCARPGSDIEIDMGQVSLDRMTG
ncbi:MAG: MOSC domain-containing protein [Alphaproteobacteria bacterium]|nr:MOSC domain-containing protein [Alphaproteobacteria bacterium]